MWGDINKSDKHLLDLHLALTDRLSDLDWEKTQIWDSRTSVHQYSIGDTTLAYDTKIADSQVVTELVVRNEEHYPQVANALRMEGVTDATTELRNGRFLVHRSRYDSAKSGTQTESSIRMNRTLLTRSLFSTNSWTDPTTKLQVNYALQKERKNCDRLIFLFTSVRGKQHWIDFDGPNGHSLAPNRSRIVYIYDDFASNYTYNLALDGSNDPAIATANFIHQYAETCGYPQHKVIISGMSKGGTSAIVAGARTPGCTVVALAPQLSLGQYLKNSSRQNIAKQMTGQNTANQSSALDSLLWGYLGEQTTTWGIRRAYILTPDNDPHCTNDLWRLESHFNRSAGHEINIHRTSSDEANNHVNTVNHLTPLFLSLLGVLSYGLTPSL